MPNDIIKLPNDIEIEAWYDPERERISIKIRRLKDGDIRNGKSGLIMRANIDSFFDIAEGEEYPHVYTHSNFAIQQRMKDRAKERTPLGHSAGCLCTVCRRARGEI